MDGLTFILLLVVIITVSFILLKPNYREGASFITGSRTGAWGEHPIGLYGKGTEKTESRKKISDHLHKIMREANNYEDVNPAILTDLIEVM